MDGDTQNLAATGAEATETEGDGSNASEAAKGGDAPTIETLAQQLKETQDQLHSTQMRMLDPDYQEYLQERRSGRQAQPTPPAKKEKVDPLEGLSDEKLAAMSNRDLLTTAIGKAVELIQTTLREEFLPEVEARLSSLGETVADQSSRRDVAEAAAKYPDFWNYQKEMVAISVNPKYQGLGAEDVYILAKAAKGGGTATTTGPTPAQKKAAAAHTEKPGTTGGGGAATGKKGQEMTEQEAAQDAWNKVFGPKK